MICSKTPLWPIPTGRSVLSTTPVPVDAEKFTLQIVETSSKEVSELLNAAFDLLQADIRALEKSCKDLIARKDSRSVLVRVYVSKDGDPHLRLDTDESYKLELLPEGRKLVASIKAKSFFGARHGFETLSQLVWLDPLAGSLLALDSASVDDAPRFKYRGLLLDTARNYFPVEDIMRTLDAMAGSKLNTFHWHATDSQSFPLKLNSTLQLALYGAYGPAAVYTAEDIRAIVRRARLRGIRVVVEIDAPAHVGYSWSWGKAAGYGDLAYCIETNPWKPFCGEPPCGQLNPQNEHVYEILEKIYAEIIELTGVRDVFHLGGDEVTENCWKQNTNANPIALWLDFMNRAFKALERANGGKVPALTLIWSSRLTQGGYLQKLDPRYGVQLWGGSSSPDMKAVVNAGFRSVMSHVDKLYLDCGYGSWQDSSEGNCAPVRQWQVIYNHRPWAEDPKWRVEGATACMWSEQLGPEGLDTRVWPRTDALAERLWSDPDIPVNDEVGLRLDMQRSRMVARGIGAVPLWPQWCTDNPLECA